MENDEKRFEVVKEKILEGLKISFEKLAREAALMNRKLVIARNGKIVKANASEFLKAKN